MKVWEVRPAIHPQGSQENGRLDLNVVIGQDRGDRPRSWSCFRAPGFFLSMSGALRR